MPLCAGIIFSEASGYGPCPGLIVVSAGAAGLLLCVVHKSHKDNVAAGVSLFLILTGSGYLLHYEEKTGIPEIPECEGTYTLRLKSYPEHKTKSYSFIASFLPDSSQRQNSPGGNILVYLTADTAASYLGPGELIRVKLKPVPVTNNGNPCEFDYKRYLAGHRVKYMAFIRSSEILSHRRSEHTTITEYSSVAARRIIETFSSAGLRGDTLGLVTALTIGEKEFLNKEYLTSFSKAGVMHVMAVSGMHVGMISLFLSYVLFFLNKKMALLKTIIILIALWLFAFITGLSPSVMRATLMFSFLQTGTIIKKPGNSLNLLLASAFILLAARPSVLFEAGFQLSYIAVLFIILFYEPFYRLLKFKNKVADYLWQMVSVSVVAQAGTFPLVVRLFNTFPLMFLVSNLVIIPLSFLIMILAIILLPFSGISQAAHFISEILSFLSHVTLGFTQFISSLNYGVIRNIGLTAGETLILTISAALLAASVLRVFKISLRPFLVSMIVFMAAGLFSDLRERNRESVFAYNIKGKSLPAMQVGRHIYLFTASEKPPAEASRHASTLRLVVHSVDPGRGSFCARHQGLVLSGERGCFYSVFDDCRIPVDPGSKIECKRPRMRTAKCR